MLQPAVYKVIKELLKPKEANQSHVESQDQTLHVYIQL